MNIKDALAVIKPHLPIFRSELVMQAWQTLEDCGTQPTAHNNARAEICAQCSTVIAVKEYYPLNYTHCPYCGRKLSPVA